MNSPSAMFIDRQALKTNIQGMLVDKLTEYLESIEDRWGIRYGNEVDMTNNNVFGTIVKYFIGGGNAAQDDVARRHEDNVFEIGEVHRRFRDIGSLDDMITNRCNRVCELLFYAEMHITSTMRLKIACKVGYTPLMNNEVGINRFRPMMADDLLPQQMLILFILKKLAVKNYRKYGSQVMKAVYTEEGHYTTAWENACTIEKFIHKNISKEINFEQWQFLTSGKDIAKRVAEYLKDHDDHEFPTVVKDRHCFAFSNGVYNVNARDNQGNWVDKFYPYETPMGDIVSCKYTDALFEHGSVDPEDAMGIPTPCLDSVFTFQGMDKDDIYWFYVLLGRMLFDVGDHDGWTVTPYFKGMGGAGKSTVINNVVKNLYVNEDVGVISNNAEKQFGLGPIADKYIVVAPEIKEDFKLDQAEVQSMISGECMSVAQKYLGARDVVWKAPIAMAGNTVPDWNDNAGSIQRRFVVFQFNKIVTNGDTALGDKIQAEYPSILAKAAKCYIQAAKEHGTKDIWNVLPQKFATNKKSMAQNTNALEAFLSSDKVVFGKDLFVPRKKFVKAFMEFAKDERLTSKPLKDDYTLGPFAKHDITLNEKTDKFMYRNIKKSCTRLMGVDLVDDEDENDDL